MIISDGGTGGYGLEYFRIDKVCDHRALHQFTITPTHILQKRSDHQHADKHIRRPLSALLFGGSHTMSGRSGSNFNEDQKLKLHVASCCF